MGHFILFRMLDALHFELLINNPVHVHDDFRPLYVHQRKRWWHLAVEGAWEEAWGCRPMAGAQLAPWAPDTVVVAVDTIAIPEQRHCDHILQLSSSPVAAALPWLGDEVTLETAEAKGCIPSSNVPEHPYHRNQTGTR